MSNTPRLYVFASRLKMQVSASTRTFPEIATEIGVTQSKLQRWVSGQVEPQLYYVARLAEVLDIPTDYLLGLLPVTNPALYAPKKPSKG